MMQENDSAHGKSEKCFSHFIVFLGDQEGAWWISSSPCNQATSKSPVPLGLNFMINFTSEDNYLNLNIGHIKDQEIEMQNVGSWTPPMFFEFNYFCNIIERLF